ncbi:MAG TPA: amidohydrolase [Anaerolineae bacterium]|nr:amidohydrolase [Anaerolineae bacterium]
MSDLILYNANIHTIDPAKPTAQSIAIRDNKILALGDDQALHSLLPSAEAIDLKCRCVIPGLIDAHLHWEWVSLGLKNIDCETPTLAEMLRRVAERVRITPPDKWIRGHGWNQNVWGETFPTKTDLDRVALNHPVYLTAKSGHAGLANSIALKLANVTASTLNPTHGEIVRDEHGEPTGVFFEDAMDLVSQKIPQVSAQELANAMRDAISHAHRVGLTGVHDFDGAAALQAWQILKENDQLNLRVSKTIPVYLLDHAIALGIRSGFGDNWLRINGVKTFADGALGPRTALMIDPYIGEPNNRGIAVTDKEEMFENVRKASAAGLSSTIHAIGDRANHDVLDVYESVRQEEAQRGESRLRHRIEHVQLLHPDDLNRLGQLKVIASMQPIHATSDMLIAEKHWGARSAGGYTWRTQLNAGAMLAFGSDAPVESFNPLLGIHAAVTRRRADGSPAADGWYPDQKMNVTEAVHGFTLGAAYASYEEKNKGSLTPGKLADLVVLNQNIFTIGPMEILNTMVEATMIDGQFVWRNF